MPSARRRIALPLGLLALGTMVAVWPASGSAQQQGWLSVSVPREWIGETPRGIGVVRRNSIRVEGTAFQPGGVDRVTIDGRRAQLEALANGEIRFVGYADTEEAPSEVEIAVYGSAPVPPVIRQYRYEPTAASPSDTAPDDAWTVGRGFEGERYAVVVGVSDYADPGITSLRYADDDAQAFYDFLVSDAAGLGGFDRANVRLLLNEGADTRSVRTALTTFLRQVTERDVVVIYLAGHGAPDPLRPSDYYLLTHDAEATNFAGTAISMDDIDQYVRQLRARDILVFTDACHAAAVSGGGVGLRAGQTNLINDLFLERLSASGAALFTFSASETNQYSQEGPQWGGGHGVFTHHLLQGLEGRADEDADGIVALGELVEYTRFAVDRATSGAQVPLQGSGSYDRSWPIAIAQPAVVADSPPSTGPSGGQGAGATEPTAERAVDLMSPTATFAYSLIIPGSGQFRTGRGWRGTVVLAGAAAAVTYGFLSKEVTKQCREATVNGQCLSGQFTNVETSRPDLVAGLATAGALTVIGAIDALLGARSVNRARLGGSGGGTTQASLVLLPPERGSTHRAGDIRLAEVRFR